MRKLGERRSKFTAFVLRGNIRKVIIIHDNSCFIKTLPRHFESISLTDLLICCYTKYIQTYRADDALDL